MALVGHPTYPASSLLGCSGSRRRPADHCALATPAKRPAGPAGAPHGVTHGVTHGWLITHSCVVRGVANLSTGRAVGAPKVAPKVAQRSDLLVTGNLSSRVHRVPSGANGEWGGRVPEPLSQRPCASGTHFVWSATPGWSRLGRGCRPAPVPAGQGGATASGAAAPGTAPGVVETSVEVAETPFLWAQNWYVVAALDHLDPSVPQHVTLLGRDLVLWRDGAGVWRTFLDECPHRRAPLSDGRIDEKGDLYCCYHGWSFEGSGKCKHIPQAASASGEAQAVNNPRAGCTSFPTRVDTGLVFVWPDEFSPQLAAATPAPMLPDLGAGWATFVRELPVSWEYLMENVVDVSHLPVAHHSIGSLKRTNAKPLIYKMLAEDRSGFEAFVHDESTFALPVSSKVARIDLTNKLVAPTLFIYDRMFIRTDGTSARGFSLGIHCTPVAEGRSLISISTRSNTQGDATLTRTLMLTLIRALPWFPHVLNHAILDGDTFFLHCQQRALHGKEGRWAQECFVPTSADRAIIAFRKWFTTYGGGRVDYFPGGRLAGFPPRLSKEQALDRYAQHTQHCTLCQGGLQTLRRVWMLAVAGAAAALLLPLQALGQLLVLGAVGAGASPFVLAGLTLVASVLAYVALLCKKTEKGFYYVGWDHAKRP